MILIAAAVLGACGGDASVDGTQRSIGDRGNAGSLETGRAVYAQYCAGCHGSDGQGGFGPELRAGQLVERYPDLAEHRLVVVEGRGHMPAWGDVLSDEEIDAVVRYEREGL